MLRGGAKRKGVNVVCVCKHSNSSDECPLCLYASLLFKQSSSSRAAINRHSKLIHKLNIKKDVADVDFA